MSDASGSDLAKIAEDAADELLHRRFRELRSRFSPLMWVLLPARKLTAGLDLMSLEFGEPKRSEPLRDSSIGRNHVFDRTVECEEGRFLLRITLNPSGGIAGLFLLKMPAEDQTKMRSSLR